MTEIAFSSSFKRAFKKRIEGRKPLEDRFWKRVEMLAVWCDLWVKNGEKTASRFRPQSGAS